MSKKSQLVNKICPSCGKEFESLKSKRQKYCSEKCKEEQNEKYIMYNCDYCGKEIRIKKQLLQDKENGKQKHIYCSRQCSNNSRRTGTMIECDNCGKLFYRRQYHIDRQKNKKQNNFCCTECQQEYRHKQTYEFRKCEVCGNEFEVSRISTQRFCSTECQNKWQTTQVRDLSSHFTSVLIPCDYCGRDHYVKQSKLNNCELPIKQYVDSKGILGNYHSFNYSVVNGDLILNNDIIIPYQDMPAKQYKQILQMTT